MDWFCILLLYQIASGLVFSLYKVYVAFYKNTCVVLVMSCFVSGFVLGLFWISTELVLSLFCVAAGILVNWIGTGFGHVFTRL